MKLFSIFIEVDPGSTLGKSCFNDLYNMNNYLVNHITQCYVFTTYKLSSNEKMKFKGYGNITFNKIMLLKKQIESVMKNIKYDEILFVHISGHGNQINDGSMDEIDGKDEFVSTGYQIIRDDDFHKMFVLDTPNPFIGIADTCHSGTMFDLNYSWVNGQWIKVRKSIDIKRHKKGMSISACKDNQSALCDVGEICGYGGALTIALIEKNILIKLIEGIDTPVYNKLVDILIPCNQTPMIQII